MAYSRTGSPAGDSIAPAPSSAWTQLIVRLHFYIGLFVGPFIFVAALTGTIFVLTPQLEQMIYAQELRNDSAGTPQPLSAQVQAALDKMGVQTVPYAVRPPPAEGYNTRVMFTAPDLPSKEHRALFIDPVTLDIRGDLAVYGTTGTLPFRTWLDYSHRSMLLGEVGRNYSELAASWLWLATLGGLYLWFVGKRRTSAEVAQRSARLKLRRLHGLTGIWIAIGLLFLSVTGLTWSKWAGGRIGDLRQTVGWVTPSVSAQLSGPAPTTPADEHAEHGAGATAPPDEHAGHGAGAAGGHASQDKPSASANASASASAGAGAGAGANVNVSAHHHMPGMITPISAQFDRILQTARQAGIDSNQIEIRTPRASGQAWTVHEYDRSWPTQVDTVAIDPATMTVTSRADFATFPLIAKLIRWGIDMHMGILFGWMNQLIMAAFGVALSVIVALGYIMWFKRRPAPGAPVQTVVAAWGALPMGSRVIAIVAALALGWSLPLMGVSLLAFLLVDLARWTLQRRRHARRLLG